MHYKSQPNAKTWRKIQKSTNVKSLTRIVWFQQFSELDRISHGADVVGQSIPGGRTRMWEKPACQASCAAVVGNGPLTRWKLSIAWNVICWRWLTDTPGCDRSGWRGRCSTACTLFCCYLFVSISSLYGACIWTIVPVNVLTYLCWQ